MWMVLMINCQEQPEDIMATVEEFNQDLIIISDKDQMEEQDIDKYKNLRNNKDQEI